MLGFASSPQPTALFSLTRLITIVGCGELANRINHAASHANDAVRASPHPTELKGEAVTCSLLLRPHIILANKPVLQGSFVCFIQKLREWPPFIFFVLSNYLTVISVRKMPVVMQPSIELGGGLYNKTQSLLSIKASLPLVRHYPNSRQFIRDCDTRQFTATEPNRRPSAHKQQII